MQEHWFCSSCKSMNRGDAVRCYRCRAPRDVSTMATVHTRHLEDVRMPGADRLAPEDASALLAQHVYNTAWPIGYLAVLFFSVSIGFGASVIALIALSMLTFADPHLAGRIPFSVDLVTAICFSGYALSHFVGAAIHSFFLALENGNVSCLGGGQPRFGSGRAFLWWLESTGWAVAVWLTVWAGILIALLVMSRPILLLLGVLLLVPWLGPFLRQVLGWIFNPMWKVKKPGRLLQDLLDRLAVDGSASGLGSLWTGSWSLARLTIAFSPLINLCIRLMLILVLSIDIVQVSSGQQAAIGPYKLAASENILIYAISLTIGLADVFALATLVRITLTLCSAERTRRRWVLVSTGPAGPMPVMLGPSGMTPPPGPPPGPKVVVTLGRPNSGEVPPLPAIPPRPLAAPAPPVLPPAGWPTLPSAPPPTTPGAGWPTPPSAPATPWTGAPRVAPPESTVSPFVRRFSRYPDPAQPTEETEPVQAVQPPQPSQPVRQVGSEPPEGMEADAEPGSEPVYEVVDRSEPRPLEKPRWVESQVESRSGNDQATEPRPESESAQAAPTEPAPAPPAARPEALSPFARAVSERREAAAGKRPEAAPPLEPPSDAGPADAERDRPEGL